MYEVLDVTGVLSCESKGVYDTLKEAFAVVGELLEDGDGNRYEIREHDASDDCFGNIEIDARHSFTEA